LGTPDEKEGILTQVNPALHKAGFQRTEVTKKFRKYRQFSWSA